MDVESGSSDRDSYDGRERFRLIIRFRRLALRGFARGGIRCLRAVLVVVRAVKEAGLASVLVHYILLLNRPNWVP